MKKITQWLKARRRRRLDIHIAKLRAASMEEKAEVIAICVKEAFTHLHFAYTVFGAKNFVDGIIEDQTTGQRFIVELRRIDDVTP